YNLPVIVVILNNEALGMVRQWQEELYDERYSESLMQTNPDFVILGESFGIKSYRFTNEGEVSEALEIALASDEPILIDARVEILDILNPMVPAGKANHELIRAKICKDAFHYQYKSQAGHQIEGLACYHKDALLWSASQVVVQSKNVFLT